MATFETKLLNEHGVLSQTPLIEEIEKVMAEFHRQLIEIAEREKLSQAELNLLQGHVTQAIGLEFSTLRLKRGAEEREEMRQHNKRRMELILKKRHVDLSPSEQAELSQLESRQP